MIDFSEKHIIIRQIAEKVAKEKILPRAKEIDETGAFPWDIVEVYKKQGFLNLMLPEKFGGLDGDITSLCLVIEELAKVSGACSLILLAHCVGLMPVMIAANEEQKEYLYSKISHPEETHLFAFCLTEAEAGSDASHIRTRVTKEGNYYYLNGKKTMITNGAVASVYTVFATSNPQLRTKGISAFFVERDYPGVIIGKSEKKMGMNGSDITEIIFDNVRLSKDNLLGKEGGGWDIAMSTLNLSRPAVGAQAVGIAQGALDFAAEYAWKRVQFGQKLADFQGIQFMIADMATQVEAARALVYDAAQLLDMKVYERDKMSAIGVDKLSAMAKMYSADVAMKVTTDAVQILGGYGYTKEYPVERMMRDAKATQIYEGTNQIQRIVIARDIFRKFIRT
ncbi:MAG: acyl-CoA dehydrogenase family protein [Desulfobacterota bacterium]|nr:acyl-CoA dehydrogenase family protein [Thermodesulfobacteriota bacterium]MDW8001173.1 acyl-CoA dehydrogenase family protein [Deltaproteobacteria bacterium]